MCGIVGIFDTRGERPVDRDLLHRMNESQHHRGPDEGGLHVEPGVGLGHRRLSIIDLATGQQPLFNEDGSVVIVFNGEVYNFQSLVPELQALGHTFRTRSDTEVVVHAWEAWGERCVERLRGMFAFAIWDRNHCQLFLARDRLGVKPLYYALLPDGHLVFGSELKALTTHPGLPRAIDPRAIEDYFAFGYVPEPKTIFAGARKLPPGHTLLLGRNAALPAPREYWDVPFRPVGPLTDAEAGHELIERLREATRVRLISEVPLGAFLSGGVDSSAVVAMMAQLSERPVQTCSIAFTDPKFDEAVYARQVSDLLKTDHYVEQVDPDDFGLVDQLAALYDEPYADSSAIPTYRVCELARKRVTVALSGDAGDEDLAGYRRYKWHMNEERVRRLFPDAFRRAVFGTLGELYPKLDWAPRIFRAKTTFQGIARDSVNAYFHTISILRDDFRERLFTPKFRQELQGYRAIEVMRGHAARSPTEDPLALVQYLDYKTYLPGDILTKVDRASMAHALEVRGPFLDTELIEWISGLPAAMKLRNQEGKYILKKALEPLLPHEILYRQKMGFAVPLAAWFRGPLKQKVRDTLLGDGLAATGYFEPKVLEHLVTQHQAGLRDYSAPIWTLLMFESFQRQLTA